MEFEDDAFVLSARAHGETGAIVDLLTESHGRYAAHVAGGASRRLKPFLQPGAAVRARFRARTSEQLGSATLEPVGEGPAAGALPEREAHPGAYHALAALIPALGLPDIWPAVFVRFEAGLLQTWALASTSPSAPRPAPWTIWCMSAPAPAGP